MGTLAAPQAATRKLGRPRLLLIGCGDIGSRIVARLYARFRIVALTSTPQRVPDLRAAGITPLVGDLDVRGSLRRLAPFAHRTLHLAPPQAHSTLDQRTRHLRAALGARPRRFIYVSTTGVYGDAQGAWLDETARAAARTERARRRIDGERVVRSAPWNGSVLRVPGIYAHDRLPLDRLQRGLPALAPEDDVYTNHIHADDLARIVIAALFRARHARVYNAVDESELKMGEYLDLVAAHAGLPPPPRLPRAAIHAKVAPAMYSFMEESRRLRNKRLREELRVRLLWPTVALALAKPARIG
jgi:nucleoside-diphosphate-sugar epimerase